MIRYLWRLVLLALGAAAIPSAADVAAKWETRTTGASEDYVKGVQQTDKDPTALAIAAIPRMRANVLVAIDSGKVANGLRRAGKSGWQAGVEAKGAAAFQNGVSAAKDKVEKAFAPLLAYESSLQAKIAAMPNVTDADRENRMLAFVRGMRQYTKS